MIKLQLIRTDKPSRLVISTSKDGLLLLPGYIKTNPAYITQHIYITSDEEIKDIRPYKGKWQLEKGEILNKFPNYLTDLSECKLVIMTTDQDLIKEGVQSIDDDFLEWFVNNPSCRYGGYKDIPWDKIITLKEDRVSNPTTLVVREAMKIVSKDIREPKCVRDGLVKKEPKDVILGNKTSIVAQMLDSNIKQETLEEASEKYARKQCDDMYDNEGLTGESWGWETSLDFKEGAKWQAERMYSEEEVLDIIANCDGSVTQAKKWFEQFKKK
jgi:hypothetical protein